MVAFFNNLAMTTTSMLFLIVCEKRKEIKDKYISSVVCNGICMVDEREDNEAPRIKESKEKTN